ncbi:acetyltransferase [Frondihabitans sp. PAMC 28766]|uniref:GNAT family N-acetyltransferase n=1 Tax=Frondihabitans sp. PAMC 28766 TaxID=1795630 RepID=UPI00078DA208|nr:GNAT family N-acetyltransferase [Frondihabitans sp. PAMC 28766]AMM19837.1 acetyltransferase [Frondihabitans sp. PAMC 28766]
MPSEIQLPSGAVLRPLALGDAAALASAYTVNRDHLAPWDPVRSEAFFTAAVQGVEIERLLLDQDEGRAVPFVLVAAESGEIVGRVNLSGIVRGVFHSANLGYWVDARLAGRGVMSAAVEAVAHIARTETRLHRLQAGTLLHNAASQAVLRHTGFTEIGIAPDYLFIAGRWQDHRLFQRILYAA